MKYIIATLMVVLLAGCGSSDSKNTKTLVVQTPIVIDMQEDVSYSVYEGDELKKVSSDAKVSITKALQGDATTVVLLEGTAQIIRAE